VARQVEKAETPDYVVEDGVRFWDPAKWPVGQVQTQSERRRHVGTVNSEPSMTKQSFSKEADIDVILKKYVETGVITHGAVGEAMFGDFSTVGDYQAAVDAVMRAQEGFDSLPAEVRSRFNNDPSMLMEFVSHEENREEAERLGLVSKKPEKEAPNVGDPVPPASAVPVNTGAVK